nr:hypothetical protein [Rhizobium sp. TH2]
MPELDDPGFAAAFDRFADRRIILLGEASHGTSEFYRARDAITRRLIERHGFNIVGPDRHHREHLRKSAIGLRRRPLMVRKLKSGEYRLYFRKVDPKTHVASARNAARRSSCNMTTTTLSG